jgi:hypothetical protein
MFLSDLQVSNEHCSLRFRFPSYKDAFKLIPDNTPEFSQKVCSHLHFFDSDIIKNLLFDRWLNKSNENQQFR